ncbi:MAG: DinB family protein [bacterium]
MHPRLTELLEYLDAQRAHVLGAASSLPPERWVERPDAERWSVSEVCWHLQRVETGVAKLIRKRANEARLQGHPAEESESSLLGALDGRRVTDRTLRIDAPSQITPTEMPTAEMVQQQLNESREMLRAAVAEADGLALETIKHPHPVLGEIDLYQWILFVGHHEARHAQQIGEVARIVAKP